MGTWENTSRMIEHWIGMTISATTIPAMKVDAVNTVAFASGLFGSAPSTSKIGIHPNQVEIQRDSPITAPWKKKRPQSP